MQRHYKDIPLFKDVTDDQWNDYRWQLRNRLTTTDDFAQVLNLDDAAARTPGRLHGQVPCERDALLRLPHRPRRHRRPRAHAGRADARRAHRAARGPEGRRERGLRLAHTAHHAPLPRSRPLRGHRDVQHVLPPLHPAPAGGRQRGHRRPGGDRQRHQVHRAGDRSPRRAHQRRRPAGARRRTARGDHRPRARHRSRGDHPHRLAHAGRLPATHHSRAGRHADEVPPDLLQHALQPSERVHGREQAGLRPSGRRRHQPRQPDGPHARHQRLCERHEEALAQAPAVPRQALLLLPVRPGRGHRALPHVGGQGHRDLREPARPHDWASACRRTSSTRSAAAGRRRCSRTT